VQCVMTCRSCGSNNQAEYDAEINIHLPRDRDKAAVLVFPKLVVCSDCGVTEFTIPETELRLLGKGEKVAAA
jgi:predicted nucleic-acid-binding Zn-ribbon protein